MDGNFNIKNILDDFCVSSHKLGVELNPLFHLLHFIDQRNVWLQDDGCKVYMDSYMTSNGSCFMITWVSFKNHLLEVGLTQNQETMALQTLTTVFSFFIMCEDPHWNSIWLRAWSHMRSHYTWRSMTIVHDFGGVLGRSLDPFFSALTISWSQLLARVWSGPTPMVSSTSLYGLTLWIIPNHSPLWQPSPPSLKMNLSLFKTNLITEKKPRKPNGILHSDSSVHCAANMQIYSRTTNFFRFRFMLFLFWKEHSFQLLLSLVGNLFARRAHHVM